MALPVNVKVYAYCLGVALQLTGIAMPAHGLIFFSNQMAKLMNATFVGVILFAAGWWLREKYSKE